MYDKHLIVDHSLVRAGDGIRVDLRIPYYRGLGLSMVDIPALEIDGKSVDLSRARFEVHGNDYALSELPSAVDDRWGFTEPARITIPGFDLEPGEHDIDATIDLRISYLPVRHPAHARKRLTLE